MHHHKKEQHTALNSRIAAMAALVLFVAGCGTAELAAQDSAVPGKAEKQMTTTQSKYYCNLKALTPEERARHKQLTEKLLTMQKGIVETAKEYEFQFKPKNVSLAELADWVAAEGKCCLFFDFHIDLENEGELLCLRLTGEEGIKQFIRAELQLPTNRGRMEGRSRFQGKAPYIS